MQCKRVHKELLHISPTVKDVAKLAGVSPSTVSRVIANDPRISEPTKLRVRAAMRELKYYPNAIARSLVRQRSQTIGVVMTRSADAALANPFFPEVIRGIGSVAKEFHYTLMLPTADTTEEERSQCMEMLRQRRVDGVIVLSSRHEDPFIAKLQQEGHPFVVVGRVVDQDVPYVNNDNVAAAYEAATHLIDLGHRKIGFMGGPPDLVVSSDRLDGYKKALDDAAIPYDPSLVCETDFSLQSGINQAKKLLLDHPDMTAILAIDDVLALAVFQVAKEIGLDIPGHLSLVGFNDSPVCPFVAPPLTSVSIPIFDIGAAAARLLLDVMAGKKVQSYASFPTRLIVRESTRAPERGSARAHLIGG